MSFEGTYTSELTVETGMKFLLPLLVVIAGMGSSIMIATNAKLSKVMDSPLLGVAFPFFIGGVVVILLGFIMLLFGKGNPGNAPTAPWWAWIGGILSVLAIVISVIARDQGGTAIIVAGTVLGQNIAAAAIDHYGWFDSDKQPFNGYKLAGILLMLVATLLIAKK